MLQIAEWYHDLTVRFYKEDWEYLQKIKKDEKRNRMAEVIRKVILEHKEQNIK